MKVIFDYLNKITAKGYSASNVFDDWLSLMLYALIGDEEKYLENVKKYRNEGTKGEREIDHFCSAFGELLKLMKETNKETLGELYMQWGTNNKYAGQFFTPLHIAEFMAQVARPRKGIISDPTCGSGVMLISAAKTMKNEALNKALFVGQDIDFTCVKMCALNFTFFNLNGYVVLGNTLTNERQRVFQTARSYFGGSIKEIDPKEFPFKDFQEHGQLELKFAA